MKSNKPKSCLDIIYALRFVNQQRHDEMTRDRPERDGDDTQIRES